ncbi:BTB/POZ protein [Apiospora sp. TS-2023a]
MQDLRIEDTVMQDQPRQTFYNKDAPIQLQVGERRFTTWKHTLTQIIFFAGMLSGRWENYTDGVLFVDADGTAFKNILRYLRTAQSFDYASIRHFWEKLSISASRGNTSKADDLVITSRWGTQKIYLCPRGWKQHRGRLDLCWEECEEYLAGKSPTYEEKPWFRFVLIKTDYAWDPTWCSGEDEAAMIEIESSK